jgi:hypothetical protein
MINQQVAYYGSSDANYVIQLSTSLWTKYLQFQTIIPMFYINLTVNYHYFRDILYLYQVI